MVLQYATSDIQSYNLPSVRDGNPGSVQSRAVERYFRGHLEVRKNVKPRKNICEALHHKKGQILRRQQHYF